ncbi:hypothetical protein RRG08_057632 [Elysia crispata]|uniref:Uncharacterized protein n=1 Tax=Elysia crispata TaxID=231223 RepID=A0AAE1A2E8_9GAST|nr:hypothetical protein RRG08_057632 [Elysia crispata]
MTPSLVRFQRSLCPDVTPGDLDFCMALGYVDLLPLQDQAILRERKEREDMGRPSLLLSSSDLSCGLTGVMTFSASRAHPAL